jgi:MoaA/NifB/PqqE/SkfB family radical SAM enzyme
VGPTNDKANGAHIGVLKDEEGRPNNLNVSDFLSSWNSTYMKNVRRQMLAGEEPPSCTKCYKEERAGHHSKRQWETRYWSERVDVDQLIADTNADGSIPPKLSYIDLRFGTKCQLACVMCSPHDSSGWIKDWQAIYPTIQNDSVREVWQWENKGSVNGSSYNWHRNNPVFWEQFYDQIPHMKQVYFAGGEPLIIDEHYEILEEIIRQGRAKDMEIRYNSNGVEWRDDLFDLWKEFKVVRYHYSVDDIGARNEYIRYPSKWERNQEVFRILDSQTSDNVEVTVACAVNALNVYYIPDFLKWKLTQGFKKINMWPLGAGGINYHFVYWPAYLNVKVLPDWFKAECERKYEEFIPWWTENWQLGLPEHKRGKVTQEEWTTAGYGINRLRGIISFMKSEDWSVRLPEMREYLERIDQHRGTDFYETFAEMKDIFKNV